MYDIIKIFKLNFKIFINAIKFSDRKERIRWIFLICVSLLFFIGIYIISYQVILYISTLPVIGSLFIIRILALAFISSFIMLIFSSLTVSLSAMYNNEDLEFLISLPVKFESIFIIKFLLTLLRSSWMIMIIIVPFSIAFAYAKNFVFYQYLILILSILIKIFISVCIGSFIAVSLSYFFPYRKLKNVVLVFIILFTTFVYSLFRVAQPEKLLSFDKFPELLEYLDFLSKPVGRNLPSWWVSEIFRGFMINNSGIVYINLLKLFVVSVIIFLIFYLLGRKMYFKGIFMNFVHYSRKRFLNNRIILKPRCFSLVKKEFKLFFREPVQWVQLVVVISLIVIYIFSIAKIPVELNYIKVSISFFNLGSIIFILNALVLRFIFIQPSIEYKNFWLVKSLPIKFWKFFVIKLFVYFPLILVPALIMCIISNYILQTEITLMILSLIITLISCFVTTIAGYSFGILFPKKEYQDITQIETSFGGLMFIILSLCYIVLILLSLAELTKKYILSQPIFIKEIVYYLGVFISINFFYSFAPLYYAVKKFLNEY
ncbi:MAG: putative ABC transporter permease subunit [Endomicrobiia bacterium]